MLLLIWVSSCYLSKSFICFNYRLPLINILAIVYLREHCANQQVVCFVESAFHVIWILIRRQLEIVFSHPSNWCTTCWVNVIHRWYAPRECNQFRFFFCSAKLCASTEILHLNRREKIFFLTSWKCSFVVELCCPLQYLERTMPICLMPFTCCDRFSSYCAQCGEWLLNFQKICSHSEFIYLWRKRIYGWFRVKFAYQISFF